MNQKPVQNEILLEQLRWRYATKKFDSTRKIPVADWKTLEDALVLTPSSFGLQPWKFLVITDQETRESLVPFSWGQRQVADCSHFVVFAIKTNLTLADIDDYIHRIAEVRGVTPGSIAGYRQMMVDKIIDGTPQSHVVAWAQRQAYIALGNFMTSAALLGIDTCPMEGFEPAEYDRLLGLTGRGLSAAVACPAGYRAVDDKYASLPKVRFRAEQLIDYI